MDNTKLQTTNISHGPKQCLIHFICQAVKTYIIDKIGIKMQLSPFRSRATTEFNT